MANCCFCVTVDVNVAEIVLSFAVGTIIFFISRFWTGWVLCSCAMNCSCASHPFLLTSSPRYLYLSHQPLQSSFFYSVACFFSFSASFFFLSFCSAIFSDSDWNSTNFSNSTSTSVGCLYPPPPTWLVLRAVKKIKLIFLPSPHYFWIESERLPR